MLPVLHTPAAADASTEAREATSKPDEFEDAMLRLDAQFASTTNVVEERHRFRQRIQLPGEAAEDRLRCCAAGHVVRLRVWSADDATRDYLVSYTSSQPLRERLLLEGSLLSLNRVLVIAQNIEQATRYAEEFVFSMVRRVETERAVGVPKRKLPQPNNEEARGAKLCYRFGLAGHLANSQRLVKGRHCGFRNRVW